jgi:hypothetical protein
MSMSSTEPGAPSKPSFGLGGIFLAKPNTDHSSQNLTPVLADASICFWVAQRFTAAIAMLELSRL